MTLLYRSKTLFMAFAAVLSILFSAAAWSQKTKNPLHKNTLIGLEFVDLNELLGIRVLA